MLPVPSPAFLFRAESSASGSQPVSPPAGVVVAVLHAGGTLDVSVKLSGTVSVPVGRWCVCVFCPITSVDTQKENADRQREQAAYFCVLFYE